MNSAKIASVLTGALGGGLVGAVGGGLGYEEDPLKGALVGGALGAGAGAGIGHARLRADTLANNRAVVSIGSNDLLHGKAQTARRGLEDIANANFVWHDADSPVREQLSRGINQHSRDASWATNELRDEAQLNAVEALIAQERLHATRARAAHAATGLGIYGGARGLSEDKTASILGHALGGAAVGGGLATASLHDKPNDIRIPGIAAAALGGGLLAGGIRGKFTRVEDLINEPELSLALPAGSGIVSGGLTSLALNPEFMSEEKTASVLRNTLGTSALAGGVGAYSGYQADTENPLRGALAGGAVGGTLGAGAGYAKGRLAQALKEEAQQRHAKTLFSRGQFYNTLGELSDTSRKTLEDAFNDQAQLIETQRTLGYVPASLALTSAALKGSSSAGTALGEAFSPAEKTADIDDFSYLWQGIRRKLPDYARDNPHVVAPILGASIGGLQGAAVANQNESDHPLASIAAGAATGGLVGLGAGYGARRGHQEAANIANEQLLNRLKHLGDPKSSRVDVNAFHDKAMDARAMLNDKALSGGWKAIGGAYGGGVVGGALGSVVTDAALHTPEEKTAAVLRRTFGV